MKRILAGAALAVLLSCPDAPAQEAGALAAYPAREVQRPILLAAKVAELSVDISSVAANQRLDQDGKVAGQTISYNLFTMDLGARYSPIEWAEISCQVPFLTGEIGEVTGGGIGDLRLGARFDLTPPGAFDFTIDFEFSMPTGDSQYHVSMVDDVQSIENFRTGDPAYNYYPGFSARYLAGNWALRARFAYVLTTPGSVVYNRLGGTDDNVEADPGDGWTASAGIYYQPHDRFVIFAGAGYETISETVIDHEGANDDTELIQITPGLIFQHSPEIDFSISAGLPLFGTNRPLAYPVLLGVRSRF